jgi:hypothetical protein
MLGCMCHIDYVPSTVIVHVAQVPCLQLYFTGTPALAHTTLKGVPPAIKIFLPLTVKLTSTSCMQMTAAYEAEANVHTQTVRPTVAVEVLVHIAAQCLSVADDTIVTDTTASVPRQL